MKFDHACVAKILVGEEGPGEFRGTGFLVTPDHVVTCAHVLFGDDGAYWADRKTEIDFDRVAGLRLSFGNDANPVAQRTGVLVAWAPPDLALIRLDMPVKSQPAPLVSGLTSEHESALSQIYGSVIGFSQTEDGRLIERPIEGHVSLAWDFHTQHLLSIQVSGGLSPGMSGSPLIVKLFDHDICLGMAHLGGDGSATSRLILSDTLINFLTQHGVLPTFVLPAEPLLRTRDTSLSSKERHRNETASLAYSMSARGYGLMALTALGIGIGLLIYYIHSVPNLNPDVRNQVYYVVLIPSAIACAVALFGAMRRYGILTAKHRGIVLELFAPATLFILILWGGFTLIRPPQDTFDLTVRAHSADGTVPIINSGIITLDLDNRRWAESFLPNGEADFKGIPGKFKGTSIRVLPQVKGFQEAWQAHRLTSNFLDLALQPAPPISFRGFVHDEGGKPLSGVIILSPDCNLNSHTDENGMFTIQIQPTIDLRCHLVFQKDGYKTYDTDILMDEDPHHRFLLVRTMLGHGSS